MIIRADCNAYNGNLSSPPLWRNDPPGGSIHSIEVKYNALCQM